MVTPPPIPDAARRERRPPPLGENQRRLTLLLSAIRAPINAQGDKISVSSVQCQLPDGSLLCLARVNSGKERHLVALQLDETGFVRVERNPVVDGFKLIERLGEGGVGVVYRVKKLDTGTEYAFKITQTAKNVPLLLAEARATETFDPDQELLPFCLRKRHIVQEVILGSQRVRMETAYAIFRLIPGETLSQLIEQGSLSLKDKVAILSSLATALEIAQKPHLDLKPSNVLVVRQGSRWLAIPYDWGAYEAVRQLLQQNLSLPFHQRHLMGTFQFLAPHLILAALHNTKNSMVVPVQDPEFFTAADIHAFGVTAYELFMQLASFRTSTTVIQVLYRKINDALPFVLSDFQHLDGTKDLLAAGLDLPPREINMFGEYDPKTQLGQLLNLGQQPKDLEPSPHSIRLLPLDLACQIQAIIWGDTAERKEDSPPGRLGAISFGGLERPMLQWSSYAQIKSALVRLHQGLYAWERLEQELNTPRHLKTLEPEPIPAPSPHQGLTLGQYLKQAGPFPLDRAVRLVVGLVEKLNQQGSGHGRLCPENILYDSETGLEPINFKRADQELTTAVPYYAAPEQILAARAPELELPVEIQQVDIYALGLIFYQMLTGVPPYKGLVRSDQGHEKIIKAIEMAKFRSWPASLEDLRLETVFANGLSDVPEAAAIVSALKDRGIVSPKLEVDQSKVPGHFSLEVPLLDEPQQAVFNLLAAARTGRVTRASFSTFANGSAIYDQLLLLRFIGSEGEGQAAFTEKEAFKARNPALFFLNTENPAIEKEAVFNLLVAAITRKANKELFSHLAEREGLVAALIAAKLTDRTGQVSSLMPDGINNFCLTYQLSKNKTALVFGLLAEMKARLDKRNKDRAMGIPHELTPPPSLTKTPNKKLSQVHTVIMKATAPPAYAHPSSEKLEALRQSRSLATYMSRQMFRYSRYETPEAFVRDLLQLVGVFSSQGLDTRFVAGATRD